MATLPNPLEHRQADYPVNDIFLRRWSPRAMTGEPVSQDQVNVLLEAARWAPSTYNEQEWRFLYAHRDTDHWQTFFELLVDANQTWCTNAGVLFLVISRKTFTANDKVNPVHTFDSGAAFQNLALQGALMDLVVHGMAGFHQDKARTALRVPDHYATEAMIAVGHPGDPDQLPDPLREREVPTGRKPIREISCQGPFAFDN